MTARHGGDESEPPIPAAGRMERQPERAQPAPVTVRPVQAVDLPRLYALLDGLDGEARYRRWFTVVKDVHPAAQWAAHPELSHAVGVVAVTRGGELVGHAASVPIDDLRAEVCFEVAAPWRHRGVAGRLLDELLARAAQRGLRTLVAEVLPENADMLAVLREHGCCREHRAGGVLELELPVPPVTAEKHPRDR